MTRSRDIADQQKNLGGAVAPFVAGKNAVINGGMDIWQRGTSFNGAGLLYCVDRWTYWRDAYASGITASQQTTSDTTNLPFIQYCLRIQRDSGNTGTGLLYTNQPLENVNSTPYIGKTVTISAYIRKGANFSSTSGNVTFLLRSGTGTNQPVNNMTGAATVAATACSLTNNWVRFTATGTVSSTATQLGIELNYTPNGTAGAADYFEVTGVQLEIGSQATPFARAGGSIGGELALCQRYFQKSYPQGTAPGTNTTLAGSVSSGITTCGIGGNWNGIRFPVVMRTAPTVTTYSYTSSTVSTISNSAGTDQGSGSGTPAGAGDSGFLIYNGNGSTISTVNGTIIHYKAEAEL